MLSVKTKYMKKKCFENKPNAAQPLEDDEVEMWSTGAIGLRTISKTRASVSSGYPNTQKQMKARGGRPSAFNVAWCLDTLMKNEIEFWN